MAGGLAVLGRRARRDQHTLHAQEARAKAVIAGDAPVKATRFVKVHAGGRSLHESSLARAQSLIGLKGYVTNLAVEVMLEAEVIAKYHDLCHVERSFRMSKTDLRARPFFHHARDAIEAHLTIVFTALAVADAGMISEASQVALQAAGLSYILRAAALPISRSQKTAEPATSIPKMHGMQRPPPNDSPRINMSSTWQSPTAQKYPVGTNQNG